MLIIASTQSGRYVILASFYSAAIFSTRLREKIKLNSQQNIDRKSCSDKTLYLLLQQYMIFIIIITALYID